MTYPQRCVRPSARTIVTENRNALQNVVFILVVGRLSQCCLSELLLLRQAPLPHASGPLAHRTCPVRSLEAEPLHTIRAGALPAGVAAPCADGGG